MVMTNIYRIFYLDIIHRRTYLHREIYVLILTVRVANYYVIELYNQIIDNQIMHTTQSWHYKSTFKNMSRV